METVGNARNTSQLVKETKLQKKIKVFLRFQMNGNTCFSLEKCGISQVILLFYGGSIVFEDTDKSVNQQYNVTTRESFNRFVSRVSSWNDNSWRRRLESGSNESYPQIGQSILRIVTEIACQQFLCIETRQLRDRSEIYARTWSMGRIGENINSGRQWKSEIRLKVNQSRGAREKMEILCHYGSTAKIIGFVGG